jgi:hypothetical protein
MRLRRKTMPKRKTSSPVVAQPPPPVEKDPYEEGFFAAIELMKVEAWKVHLASRKIEGGDELFAVAINGVTHALSGLQSRVEMEALRRLTKRREVLRAHASGGGSTQT